MDRSAPPGGSRRRTSITRADLEADTLWRLLCSPRGTVIHVEDVEALPDLRHWHRARLGRAVDQLVGAGVLTENASGILIVAPHPEVG